MYTKEVLLYFINTGHLCPRLVKTIFFIMVMIDSSGQPFCTVKYDQIWDINNHPQVDTLTIS